MTLLTKRALVGVSTPNPAPVLQSWHCTRGHKLALLALAPGSRVSVYCRKCGCWYEKEMAPAPVGPTLDKA